MTLRVGLVGDSQGAGLKGPLAIALRRRDAELVAAITQVGASLRTLSRLVEGLPEGLDLLVIVSGGGNDTTSITAPSRWTADVRAVVQAARARAPKAIVWVGPFPAREGVGVLAAEAKITAREEIGPALEGLRRIDGFDLARGIAPTSADGMHFSAAAWTTMAELLAPQLLAPQLLERNAWTWIALGLGGVAAVSVGFVAWLRMRR